MLFEKRNSVADQLDIILLDWESFSRRIDDRRTGIFNLLKQHILLGLDADTLLHDLKTLKEIIEEENVSKLHLPLYNELRVIFREILQALPDYRTRLAKQQNSEIFNFAFGNMVIPPITPMEEGANRIYFPFPLKVCADEYSLYQISELTDCDDIKNLQESEVTFIEKTASSILSLGKSAGEYDLTRVAIYILYFVKRFGEPLLMLVAIDLQKELRKKVALEDLDVVEKNWGLILSKISEDDYIKKYKDLHEPAEAAAAVVPYTFIEKTASSILLLGQSASEDDLNLVVRNIIERYGKTSVLLVAIDLQEELRKKVAPKDLDVVEKNWGLILSKISDIEQDDYIKKYKDLHEPAEAAAAADPDAVAYQDDVSCMFHSSFDARKQIERKAATSNANQVASRFWIGPFH